MSPSQRERARPVEVVPRDFTRSQAHAAAAHRVIPGGAHTYSKGDDQYPEGMAPVIERGDGCRVRDVDGNEYVEFGMGGRSVTLGHNYAPVVDAVRARLADGVSFVRPHSLELTAAERLVELIPSAEMVKFGLNGSDVTSAAVRLARAYTGLANRLRAGRARTIPGDGALVDDPWVN